jgi:hypothetical protein
VERDLPYGGWLFITKDKKKDSLNQKNLNGLKAGVSQTGEPAHKFKQMFGVVFYFYVNVLWYEVFTII